MKKIAPETKWSWEDHNKRVEKIIEERIKKEKSDPFWVAVRKKQNEPQEEEWG